MSARAGIVVTGTEVLTGRVRDANGPWLADQLLDLGVDLAHITICGDRRADLTAQLRFMAAEGVDLVVTSGGLGPTADDLTTEIVAHFCGRALLLDEELEQRIDRIVSTLLDRFPDIDRDALRAGTRKQAMVPEGATILEPAGTAPGCVVAAPDGPTVVVLPGPPGELQAMWADALETDGFKRAVASRTSYRQHTLRLFGIPESEIAETLRVAERQIDGFGELEITTCLRRAEVEVVVRHEPDAHMPWTQLLDVISVRHERTLFSTDGSTVDDQVAALLRGRALALAESCTGGLLAARITDRPGASDYFAGAVVSYSNEAKSGLLGVDPALIDRHGAVSEQTAEAMAAGALERFGADTAVSVTGIAGPGGGTPSKPVGTVCFCVLLADGRSLVRDVLLPGGRAAIRDRSTTVALHLLRRVLHDAA